MLMTMMIAAEILLITRLWALWDRAIWVPYTFAILLAAEIGVSAYVLGEEAGLVSTVLQCC